MFSKILVGVDGSEAAQSAVIQACDLARRFDAEIYLAHITHAETVAFATGAVAGYHAVTTMPDEKTVKAAGEKIVAAAREAVESQNCRVTESFVERGDSGDGIIAIGEKIGADLIVTGRRGLGNIAGLILGSTSQRIAHYAKCAVLTVPIAPVQAETAA